MNNDITYIDTRGINCKVQQNKLKSKSVVSMKIKNKNKAQNL